MHEVAYCLHTQKQLNPHIIDVPVIGLRKCLVSDFVLVNNKTSLRSLLRSVFF